VLHGVEAPVLFGVGEDSAYEQLPAFMEKSGTVLIQRELLLQKQNPGTDLQAKLAGFACVLAHEMAHHALRHDWRANERHRDVSEMSVERRRSVLERVEAHELAATTGLPYEVIVNHWGIADDAMRAKLIEYAAAQSDEQAMRADEESVIEHRNVADEAGIHVAEEWGAAVVGCMMRFRLNRGREFALERAHDILGELPPSRGTLTETVLTAACQSADAEARAIELAIATLETAFHNPDMEDCGRRLEQRSSGWASMFA
jgi:hypothetical protein